MTAVRDLTGMRFTRLVVVGESHRTPSGVYWECKCDCGASHVVRSAHLTSGNVQSCGCYSADMSSKRLRGSIPHNRTHNARHTPEYIIWRNMRTRCRKTDDRFYSRYGGRGIKVCDRWNDFSNFIADMGPRPSPAHSIDRIDNEGNYEPSNCRWATAVEQSENRSTSWRITIDGQTKSLCAWERHFGLPDRCAHQRIKKLGWDVIKALTTPPRGTPK